MSNIPGMGCRMTEEGFVLRNAGRMIFLDRITGLARSVGCGVGNLETANLNFVRADGGMDSPLGVRDVRVSHILVGERD